MEGVGPGTVLGGRYTVGNLAREDAGAQRWSADDPDLGRAVSLLVLPSADHRSAALLDAARMAAGLEIPGAVRILDIGSEGPVVWVVEESLGQAQSVVDLVRRGGIPGDEVRRIVGEASTALAAAAARGVHHLRLTPEEVFRTTDGDVKVRGLATEAVLHGAEEDSDNASRTDAIALVAVTYAALTGLWPLRDIPSTLPAAPRLVNGVPAPSEIAAGVPRDIDTQCRLTLTGRGGPTSPGDYARQLAPWSSRQILGRTTLPAPEAADTTASIPAVPAAGAPVGEPGTPHEGEAPAPETPPVQHAAPATPAGTTGDGHGRPGDVEGIPAPGPAATAADRPDDGRRSGSAAAAAAGVAAAATGAGAAAAGAGAAGARAAAAPGAGPAAYRPGPTGGAATTAPPRRPAPPRPKPSAPNRLRRATTALASAPVPRMMQVDDDAPAPLVPSEPLTKDESKVALGIVAAFVLLSLLVGIYGVSRIGSNTNFDLSVGTHSTARATASATPVAPAGPQPLAILSADGFDPAGDQRENGQAAPKVFDGDPNTAWTSEGYKSPNLGGLKPGVGVIVDLGPNVTPKHVDLTLGSTVDLEVYVAPDRSLDNATKVAEGTDVSGTTGYDLPPEQTAGKQYLIVWFTKVSKVDDGLYRAVLGEVSVLG